MDSDYRMHGCDEFCRIISGWTCTNYYHHLIRVEFPLFTSQCYQTTDQCSGSSSSPCQRRLSPQDFDSQGRLLHHVQEYAYKYLLPVNTHEMRNDKLHIHFNAKFGTNGQIRLIESPGTNEAVFGFILAYTYEDT